MKFYLGTNEVSWLRKVEFPLFISRRRLYERRAFPRATCDWALDSGGYTELTMHGRWRITVEQYVKEVLLYEREIGRMDWAAPMDSMCEMHIMRKTGLTVEQHQKDTVDNFLRLRQELGYTVIPVLQGWQQGDHLRCAYMYDKAGIDLSKERAVGVGSVCRRQGTTDVENIFRSLDELNAKLHGFGVKSEGIQQYGDILASADSMAWAARARYIEPLDGCTHKHCTSCLKWATIWREIVLNRRPREVLEWREGVDISEWRHSRGLRQLYGSRTG